MTAASTYNYNIGGVKVTHDGWVITADSNHPDSQMIMQLVADALNNNFEQGFVVNKAGGSLSIDLPVNKVHKVLLDPLFNSKKDNVDVLLSRLANRKDLATVSRAAAEARYEEIRAKAPLSRPPSAR